MGIRDRPISPQSLWQNGHMERLIGTVRRECLDRMLILGEAHLRRVLTLYTSYYNESRTHLSLHKDAPLGRAVQRYGNIAATPVLSGLHHRLRADMISGNDRSWKSCPRRHRRNMWTRRNLTLVPDSRDIVDFRLFDTTFRAAD